MSHFLWGSNQQPSGCQPCITPSQHHLLVLEQDLYQTVLALILT